MRCRWRADYPAGPVSRTYPEDSAAAAPPLVPGPARAGTELCRVLSPLSGSAGQRFIEFAREPVQSLDKPARRSVKSSCLSSLAEHSENRMYSRMISCVVVALAVTGAGSAILGVAPAVAQPPLSSGADVPGFAVVEASMPISKQLTSPVGPLRAPLRRLILIALRPMTNAALSSIR
jgi:hypothetical protein